MFSKVGRESIREKLRRTFSKTEVIKRSVSAQSSKRRIKNEEKRSRHKSINSKNRICSRSPSPKYDKTSSNRTQKIIKDDNKNVLSTNNDGSNNFHYFIYRPSTEKKKRCDFCKGQLILNAMSITCTYCRMVYHTECINKVGTRCNNNQLLILTDLFKLNPLSIQSDFNSNISKSFDIYGKTYSDIDLISQSEFYTFDSNANEDESAYQRITSGKFSSDSLVNTPSFPEISPSSSRQFYDFTTLDRDSIYDYGIKVNPISAVDILPFVTSTSNLSSNISKSVYNHEYCKPSFIYNEFKKEITRIDWNVDILNIKTTLFNKNNIGLNSEMRLLSNETCLLGTVRVYINLLRPIQMEFSSPSPSISDVIDAKGNKNKLSSKTKIESIWLPRGSSKRLYVYQSTSTTEVINCLLKKFYIKADPKIFGLYEHTIEGDRKVSVRKLADIECPLGLLLSWTDESIDKFNSIIQVKRFVLQENETGDIEWSEFSKPELQNFLLILKREQQDISDEIRLKYSILKNEVIRLRDHLLQTANFITVL